MALASEMNGPMTIGETGWQRAGEYGSKTGYYSGFTIYMGHSGGSELTPRFDDNYLPGTRVMVYSTSSQTMTAEPDGWMSVPLETPFEYNGTDNLIVEIEWTGGSNIFYTWMWETGANRGLLNTTDTGNPSGELRTAMSRLLFTPASSLDRLTFGGIKTLW